MGITLKYNPAYENVLGVANDTGQGNLRRQLEEIARRDALDQQRLDESARQFDQGLQAQQYNQVASRGLQWANVAQNQAQLDQQAYNQQATLEARMAEQQMQNDAYAYGQDAQTQRAYGAEQARMAREAANRRFEKSMKDREILLDQFKKGMLTPAQEQQARAMWERDSQMSWGMPDEMAANEDNQAMQERVKSIEAFFTHPITKEPLIGEGQVASMLELGMDPNDIVDKGLKLQSEARQVESVKMKSEQEKLKQEKVFSDMEADNLRAQQQLQNTQTTTEQKMAMAAEQHKQKMMMNAVNSYQAARLKWAAGQGKAEDDESKAKFGPEPKLEDFLLPEMSGQDSGQKIITNQYGKRAIQNADGSLTPID